MKRIKISQELCMACMNCVLGCMAEHNDKGLRIDDLDLSDLHNEARNHISQNSHKTPAPIFCRHCDEPECVITCMSGAMKKDAVTGVVSYDKDACASCFMCVMACPYGVLKADAQSGAIVMKCDLCGDKEVPRCVEMCPTGCITMEEGGEQK